MLSPRRTTTASAGHRASQSSSDRRKTRLSRQQSPEMDSPREDAKVLLPASPTRSRGRSTSGSATASPSSMSFVPGLELLFSSPRAVFVTSRDDAFDRPETTPASAQVEYRTTTAPASPAGAASGVLVNFAVDQERQGAGTRERRPHPANHPKDDASDAGGRQGNFRDTDDEEATLLGSEDSESSDDSLSVSSSPRGADSQGQAHPAAPLASWHQWVPVPFASWHQWVPVPTWKWLGKQGRLFLQIGSVLQWCTFNIIMILVNNEIYQSFKFTFPLTLTTIHFVLSFVGAYVVIEVLRLRPKAEVDYGSMLRWVCPMATVTCFNVVLAQLSARYIPVHMLLVTKALSPGLTVLLQAVAVGSEFDPCVCLSLLPVMGGMVMAYAQDARDQLGEDLLTALSALGSVVLGCATVVCAEVLLKEQTFHLDSINALYQMVPVSALMLAPPALFFEGREVRAWWHSLIDPLPALAAITISGFFAFCLNFSLFYTIQKTSALTFNVAGNLKMAVSIIFAGILFHAPMTQLNIAGCAVEISGVVFYGWALFRIRKQKLNVARSEAERKRLKEEIQEDDVNIYLGAMI